MPSAAANSPRDAIPSPDAVRIEELLNYFSYDYPAPEGEDPLSLVVDAGPCPWEPSHRLVRIGLRVREIPAAEIPPSNFIYLIDVSGSMTGRLPLVQASMKMLTDNLRPGDRVSVVTYADGVRVVSENVPGSERRRIKDVIDGLTASGSTAGGAGLECAYEVAGRCFIPGGNNRIVLCSDGDFNVGPSSDDEMGALIERQRKQSGVRLSVLGYGMGNYKDRKMQLMAERGDGNYAYVDDMREAAKVLFREFGATAWAVAHDVKMQVEFNPALVASYRLVGYESRLLESEDFNDDRRDAGEIGAGHCVTALYELIPVGVEEHPAGTVDALRYQGRRGVPVVTIPSSETLAVKVRYKLPGERRSRLMQAELVDDGRERLTGDFAFAAAVAMYGQLLRLSDFRGGATWDEVIRLAQLGLGNDPEATAASSSTWCAWRRASAATAVRSIPHRSLRRIPLRTQRPVPYRPPYPCRLRRPAVRPVPFRRPHPYPFLPVRPVPLPCLRTADLADRCSGRRNFAHWALPHYRGRARCRFLTGCPAGTVSDSGRFPGIPGCFPAEDLSLSVTLRSRTATVRSRRMPPVNCPP